MCVCHMSLKNLLTYLLTYPPLGLGVGEVLKPTNLTTRTRSKQNKTVSLMNKLAAQELNS